MIELSGLKLKVNGLEFELTIEDAKKLYDELNLIFKKEYTYIPTTYPSKEVNPYKPYNPIWNPGVTYCCGGAGNGTETTKNA